MKRIATITWRGSAKFGTGELSTESGALKDIAYSWHSRFEEGAGTNPEELLAAAHGGCFSMKLSAVIADAGFTPERIHTNTAIVMEDGVITASMLEVQAHVPGIGDKKFQQCLEDARKNCPMSKALSKDIKITAEGKLIEE